MTSYVRLIFAILVTLTSFASVTATSAQPDSATIFESELTGDVIDIGDSGEVYLEHRKHIALNYSDGTSYEHAIGQLRNSVIYMTIITGGETRDVWLDAYISSDVTGYPNHYIVLGQELNSERAWFLAEQARHFDFIYYGYHDFTRNFDDDHALLVAVNSHASALNESTQWTKDNITVDGRAVLQEVEVNEMDAMVNGTSDLDPITFDPFTSTIEDWVEAYTSGDFVDSQTGSESLRRSSTHSFPTKPAAQFCCITPTLAIRS